VSESDLVASILLTFGARHDLKLWRANVLVAKDKTGRVLRAGVTGQADISGILAPSGRRVEVEVKTATGRQSPDQKRWQTMIEAHGGIYILARSTDDVARGLGL
jgi:hypothetical protein